jgi:hypothetical protein
MLDATVIPTAGEVIDVRLGVDPHDRIAAAMGTGNTSDVNTSIREVCRDGVIVCWRQGAEVWRSGMVVVPVVGCVVYRFQSDW